MKNHTKFLIIALTLAGTNAYSENCPTLNSEDIVAGKYTIKIDGEDWNITGLQVGNTRGHKIVSIGKPNDSVTKSCIAGQCCFYDIATDPLQYLKNLPIWVKQN